MDVEKTAKILSEKQYQRSLIITGVNLGNVLNATMEYERSKEWAIKLGLADKVHPNVIDPLLFQLFSDLHKDRYGIRPSQGLTYDQMKKTWQLWDNEE